MELNKDQIEKIEKLTKGKYIKKYVNKTIFHIFQHIPTNTFVLETHKYLWTHMVIINNNINNLVGKEPNYSDPKPQSRGIPREWLIPLGKILKGEK